jgi:hypothetical protein
VTLPESLQALEDGLWFHENVGEVGFVQLLGQTEGQFHPLVDVQPLKKTFILGKLQMRIFLWSTPTLGGNKILPI